MYKLVLKGFDLKLIFLLLLLQKINACIPSSGATCYQCQGGTCVFMPQVASALSDLADCMTSCNNGGSNTSTGLASYDPRNFMLAHWKSVSVGACHDCSIQISMGFPLNKMFGVLGINAAQMCDNFRSELRIPIPSGWFKSNDATITFKCSLNGIMGSCSVYDSVISYMLSFKDIKYLMTASPPYIMMIDGLSSPPAPNKTLVAPIQFTFSNTPGCLSQFSQQVSMNFSFDSLIEVGQGSFKSINWNVSNPAIGQVSLLTLEMVNGAKMAAGYSIVFAPTDSSDIQTGVAFSNMFSSVSINDVNLIEPFPAPLAFGIKNNVAYITFPSTFNRTIENGVRFTIAIDNVQNPTSTFQFSSATNAIRFTAFYNERNQTNNASFVDFYNLTPLHYNNAVNPLNVISAVVFGLSMFLSLFIIRWHGLPFTPYSIWTDLVAVFSVMCFAMEFIAYILWMLAPSQAFFYFYSFSYCCTASMIISLCFHWASVLSGKLLKRITFRSPTLMAYVGFNLVVYAVIGACIAVFDEKLACVYHENALACQSMDECSVKPAADGAVIRRAVRLCKMSAYYITLTALFTAYTLLLMILGCMVMNRGRMVMLSEDVSMGLRIRHSLTIFYIIIASTCVIYTSAQVIYILQAVDYDQLDERVWYVFVVWLPQCLPPLLLLFLQWNPSNSTSDIHDEKDEMPSDYERNEGAQTPSSCASSPQISRTLNFSRLSEAVTLDKSGVPVEESSKIGFCVRLKVPSSFHNSAGFISLEYCAVKENVRTWQNSNNEWLKSHAWNCVGMTERVDINECTDEEEIIHIPFLAVLEIPIVGPMSNTLLRFLFHWAPPSCFTETACSRSTLSSSISSETHNIVLFKPFCEFVTCAQTVLDAAVNQQPLQVTALKDDHSAAVLTDTTNRLSSVQGMKESGPLELSVQTVMHANELGKIKGPLNTQLRNIVRFFQYDSIASGGLVVEDLQESKYSNIIPRQLLEVISIQRQEQLEQARLDFVLFNSQKTTRQNHGFYGNLIGQIQTEGDFTLTRKWLQNRVQRRKEYVGVLRKAMQTCINRDKAKEYFKASVEKKTKDLMFLPINLHIQDLYVGPMSSFTSVEKRKASKDVSTYEITTVGAMAAHVYNFKNGGILSLQTRLHKLRDNLPSAVDSRNWPEELREYDDLLWDIQLRMDVCFPQAVAALVTSFCRKVEIALQNPDIHKGEDILRQISTLGFLFQVESLLSTHGKEIGMLEDMTAAVAQLSCVVFVLEDVSDKPMGRFSFRNIRRKGREESNIAKVYLTDLKETGDDQPRYLVTLQIYSGDVVLPERLAAGGRICVTPVIFTQGINEMQTIANKTERSKAEVQETINANNLRPLKAFCDKYCRLAVALPPPAFSFVDERSRHGMYQTRNQAPMRMSEDEVSSAFDELEACIKSAAESAIKTKHPEILTRASDLCRELGGGRVTVCKSAKDRTAMSVTLEQGRILYSHHNLPEEKIPATVAVMRTHGVRIENALKNTGKRIFAFNKLQRSLLPEEYRCPDAAAGGGNVS